MSMYLICERCNSREHYWNVKAWTIRLGELNREPRLCETCTKTVERILIGVLKPVDNTIAKSATSCRIE